VYVEWDVNARQAIYRYGRGSYDVLVVDAPRTPPSGHILAVGCVVRPGKQNLIFKTITKNVFNDMFILLPPTPTTNTMMIK